MNDLVERDGTQYDNSGNVNGTYSEGVLTRTTKQEIKELLELRKLIKAKFEELLHPKVEERDVEEDVASVVKKLRELIELEREIDIRIYELLHPKVEERDVEEDLFLFAGTLEELIELERTIDARIELLSLNRISRRSTISTWGCWRKRVGDRGRGDRIKDSYKWMDMGNT